MKFLIIISILSLSIACSHKWEKTKLDWTEFLPFHEKTWEEESIKEETYELKEVLEKDSGWWS